MSNPSDTVTGLSRRTFLGGLLMTSAASAAMQAHAYVATNAMSPLVASPTTDVVEDTFNALLAFVLPGRDAYSVAQGVSDSDPGGAETGVVNVFISTVDASTPYVPAFSSTVATLLNQFAMLVNPAAASGPFVSPFARLSFAEKAAVFQIMDGIEPLKLLGGLLPLFTAFFAFSEAGVYDPATRALSGPPLGWTLCRYSGVSDGRDECLGYFPEVPHA